MIFNKTDLKYTLRLLSKKPGFTFISVLVLAGGLGLSIFTVSFSYNLGFKPLPGPNGHSIVRLCAGKPGSDCRNFKAFEFARFRDDIQSLESLTVSESEYVFLETDELVQNVSAARVEPAMFSITETLPVLGRWLQLSDLQGGAEPVAVISHDVWQVFFDGDADVIDAVIRIDNVATRIVGVMPQGYGFPTIASIWLPILATLLNPANDEFDVVAAYARLKPGVSRSSATQELSSLMARVRSQFPVDPDQQYRSDVARQIAQADAAQVMSVPRSLTGGIEGLVMILIINGLALLVFLLVCINVGTLLLSRVNERVRDVSIRVALGAPRARLMAQVMGESVLIALLSGVLGILMAGIAMEILNVFLASTGAGAIPYWFVFRPDASTLLAVTVFLAFTILVVSAIPSWRIINGDFNRVMRDGTRGSVGIRTGRLSRALVIAAISLITILLYIGVLAGGSAVRLKQIASGVDSTNLVGANLQLPAERYSTAQRLQFHQAFERGLAAESELTDALIYLRHGETLLSPSGDSSVVFRSTVTEILGPPATFNAELEAGRHLSDFDRVNGSPVAVISRSLADQLWPGESPLDQQFSFANPAPGLPSRLLTVVGVLSNEPIAGLFTREFSLNPSNDSIYLPLTSGEREAAWLLARHSGDSDRAASIILRVLEQLDPQIDTFVDDFEEDQTGMFAAANYGIGLVVGCGLFAFLVAITGIYGLTRNFVNLHIQEIGTRRALGATDRRISLTFLLRGSRQLITGFLIATGVAVPLIYLLLSITGGGLIDEGVILSLVIAVVVLFATVLLAILQPIEEILKLEPSDALRYQ